MDIVANDLVGRGVGAGDAALHLTVLDCLGQGRERLRRLIAGLHLHRPPSDAAAVEPWRRAGLEPAERKAQSLERQREPKGGCLAHPPGRDLLLADMDEAAQERSSRQHHCGRPQLPAIAQPQTRDPAVRHRQIIGLGLDHAEICGFPDGLLHGRRIKGAIGLGARPAHRRALAPIEHPELNAAAIRHSAHEAIERIDLAHQMTLAKAPDRRIAGHRPDGGKAVRDQRRRRPHAGRRRRRLTAGVATTHHDHVELGIHRKSSPGASIQAVQQGQKARPI